MSLPWNKPEPERQAKGGAALAWRTGSDFIGDELLMQLTRDLPPDA